MLVSPIPIGYACRAKDPGNFIHDLPMPAYCAWSAHSWEKDLGAAAAMACEASCQPQSIGC